MDKIKNLQVKRLLKELEYIESDFEYRNEVINEADNSFIKSINDFLVQHPEIKELYDKKVTEKINKSISTRIDEAINQSVIEDEYQTIDDVEVVSVEKVIDLKQEKIKKIYRDIVKITHPDIVNKKKLNDLYIQATKFYDQKDKIGLYKVCNELQVDYDLDEEDEVSISEKIGSLKQRINFLESTFTWKWHNTQNEVERNQILINYIKLRIS